MKRTTSLLLSGVLLASAANAQSPETYGFTDYTGTSFKVHWTWPDKVNLNVFSVNEGDEVKVSQDFSSVIKNAKIDTEAVKALAPMWTLNVSGAGTTDVVYVNDKDRILLDGDGDFIGAFCPDGFLKSMRVKAWLTNAEGISEDNSSVIRIELLDNNGNRYMYGQTYSILFGKVQEYDFADAFEGYFSDVCGVRLVMEMEEGHTVGNIAIDKIEFEYDTRNMIVDNKEVTGGEYLVENCDPEKRYYYFAVNPADGARSDIERVDGFIAPALDEPTEISSSSYTANWGIPYKAQALTVSNWKVTRYDNGGVYNVFDETFDDAKTGTMDEPVSVASLDEYTVRPGWTFAEDAAIIANGMIGTKESPTNWPPMGGYLYTPRVDLSYAGGKYTISTRVLGTPGDMITFFRENSMTPDYRPVWKQITFDENGVIEDSWTMEDGIDNTIIQIESKGKKQFFIDYFKVSFDMPAGSVATELAQSVNINDVETRSYTFDDLEENGLYAYSIVSHGLDSNGYDRDSEKSPLKMVQLSDKGSLTESTASDACRIYSTGGAVMVTPAEDCAVEIVGLDGVVIARANVAAGITLIQPVEAGRVVIVRAGTTARRLLTR